MNTQSVLPLESKILASFLDKYGIKDIYRKEYDESRFEGSMSLNNMYTWIQVPVNWKKSILGVTYMLDLNFVWHAYLDEKYQSKDISYVDAE
jgi:hypothetical protein